MAYKKDLKFYIAVDCEGVACAVGECDGTLGTGPNYAFACKQATAETNAAVTALFDVGASEVIVWDTHGTGVNLLYDELDPRCKILIGSGHKGRFVGLDESFTAVLFIGYHAMSNTAKAVLSHTYSHKWVDYYKINGCFVGEFAVDSAYAGEKGVPILFCCGDDAFISEVYNTIPNSSIVTVTTKTALSRTSAISKHPLAVCHEISQSLRDYCKKENAFEDLPIYKFPSPVMVELKFRDNNCISNLQLRLPKIDEYTVCGEIDNITELL